MRRALAALALLPLLALPASAHHEPGDCAYQGPAPVPGGSGDATLCLMHVDERAPAGAKRTELDALHAQLYEEWLVAGRRAWVGSLTEADQYAFANAFGTGNGTRVASDTGAWAYHGAALLAGASAGAGARQYDFYGTTAWQARLEAGAYVPVAQSAGVGVYYAQASGNGRCTEGLALAGGARGMGFYEPLWYGECLAELPRLPMVVRP